MVTETKSRNPFAVHPSQGVEVSGHVTHDSVEDLFPWIEWLLFRHGDRRDPRPYTLVRVHGYAGSRPSIKTGQQAHRVELLQDDCGCAIQVHDTGGTWSLLGQLATQPKGGDGDVLRESMHVVVGNSRLEVQLRTPDGLLAWWALQVEGETSRA